MAEEIKGSIRQWWASYPMTYGVEHGDATYIDGDGRKVNMEFGSREFFEHADRIFYGWNEPRHDGEIKFGKIFDYAPFRGRNVLEIGCGMGCMAMNWALQGASVTAVDLNPVSVDATQRRFKAFGLEGRIMEADAESLPFADGSFDFVYSWGVLHHTPGIRKALQEVFRVLAPGGRTGVMLYSRSSLLHRYITEYIEGYVNMESEFLDPLQLASRYGDGFRQEGNPHTWPVTEEEIREELFAQFESLDVEVFGTDMPGIMNQLLPGLGGWMPKPMLSACMRRLGWSLWIKGRKPS